MRSRWRRSVGLAVVGAVTAALLEIPAGPAAATSTPAPPENTATQPAPAAPQSAAPTTPSPNFAKARALTATDTARAAFPQPATVLVRPSDGAVAARDLSVGAVRPLDGTTRVPDIAPSPCGRPVGSVRAPGPGGIWLTGVARCEKGVWRMNVTGGTGTIGGMPLASQQFSGFVQWSARGVTSRVQIGLPLHPRVVPSWTRSAWAVLERDRGPWVGTVSLTQQGDQQRLVLHGSLSSDNLYSLAASGWVRFAKTTIPLAGWYRSAEPGVSPRWSIRGSGPDGMVAGARIVAPQVQMTQAVPGVTGRATVRVSAPSRMEFPTALNLVGAGNWSLSVSGEPTSEWSPNGVPGVSVNIAGLSGAISGWGRLVRWTLSAPMTLVDDRMTVTGSFDFQAANQWRLRPTQATGQILDQPDARVFTGTGAVYVGGGKVSGSLDLRSDGSMLIDLPAGWTSSTLYSIEPAAGSVIRWRRTVRHESTLGTSTIALVGSVRGAEPYRLIAVGHLDIAGTPVPVGGEFNSVGWVRDGVPLTEPYWDTHAAIQSAVGGRVPLRGGLSIVGGSFGFTSGGAPSAPLRAQSSDISTATTTVTGTVEVSLASGDPYTVTCTYAYTDANNWTLTAAGNSSNAWSPFSGISIPETSFTGSVTYASGVYHFGLTIPNVAWTNMTNGATMATTTFTISDTCPLANQANCPQGVDDALYVGASTASISFTDGTPTLTSAGAFLADRSWARWDANAAPITWNGITISNVKMVAWHGPRNDADSNLVMPDISGGKLGFEFCGTFQVVIPDITTAATSGCTEWSRDGVVMAQAITIGNFSTQPNQNVNISGGTMAGYAWSNLADPQIVKIRGVDVELAPNRQNLTANLTVPGSLMHDLGTGTSDTTVIPATGWFDADGNFAASASIPVNLAASGVTLTAITVGVGKDGHNFTISFGAEADARVNGQHYPVVATISAASEGAMVTVSLDIKGSRTIQQAGGFDASNLLPTGNFEPAGTSTVDGSFDGNQAPNVITDGGFENGSDKSSLVSNPGFEDNSQNELVANGGFETSSGRNILDNSDAEDTNLMHNGDFDTYLDTSQTNTGTYLGWTVDSNFSASVVADAAPTTDPGTYAVQIRNTKSSTTTASGLRQKIGRPANPGQTYRLTAWVKAISGSGTAQATITRDAGTSGCTTSSSQSSTLSIGTADGWKKMTVDMTIPNSTCVGAMMGVVVDPYAANFTLEVDSVRLDVVGVASGNTETMYTVNLPSTYGRFDGPALDKGSYSSRSTLSSFAGGVLRSDGCSQWAYLDGAGYMSGDFEASVDVFFPAGDNARDIFDFAFAMNGSGTAATGWAYRVQSSGTDSGFFKITGNGGKSAVDGSNTNPLNRETWYTLRVVVIGKQATAWVTKLNDGSQVSRVTTTLPNDYNGSGYFGQAMDNACSNQGHYLDNFAASSVGDNHAVALYDPAHARPHTDGSTNNGYIALRGYGGLDYWNAMYDVRQDSDPGTYTYSAWVKSSGSTINANLNIETTGGELEFARQPITVTSQWQQVSVTLPVQYSGHSGLRAGFIGIRNSDDTLMIDDQSLSLLEWTPSSVGQGDLTMGYSEDAHSGAASMSFTPHVDGTWVYYYLPKPVPGARYHVRMWVKSNQQWSGTAYLSVGSDWASSNFTTNAPDGSGAVAWTQLAFDYSPPSTTNMMALQINAGAGTNDQQLLIDDVSITATYVTDRLSGAAGDIPQPPGWATNQGTPRVIFDPATSHGGNAYMRVTANGSSERTSYAYSRSFLAGEVYTMDVYVKSPEGYGSASVYLSQNTGSCTAAGAPPGIDGVALTFSWQKVSVSCKITGSGVTSLTVTVWSSSTTARLDVDDVQLQTAGMALADPWAVTGSGGTPTAILVNDPATAHSGNSYLAFTSVGTSGKMVLDAPYTYSQGSTAAAGVWMRSATGSNISAQLAVYAYDSAGTLLQQNSVGMTVSGTTWYIHYVSQPFPSNTVKVRTEIQNNTSGSTLYVDDIDSRPLATWAAYAPNPWSFVHRIDDASSAASGTGFLRMATWGSPPTSDRSGVATTITQTVNAGTRYDIQAYVRSPSSPSTAGRLGFTYGVGQSNAETSYQTFTATGTWQLVQFSFTAGANHGSSTTRAFVETENGGELDVDQISITPKVLPAPAGWVSSSDGGGSGTWQNLNDSTNAHDGSSGVVAFSKSSSTGRAGFATTLTTAPAQGDSYTVNAWVRSPSGTSITGAMEMSYNGGTVESVSKSFTTPQDGSWLLVSGMIKAANTGHNGITVKVLQSSSGTLYVDDVALQRLDWTGAADAGSTVTQQIMYDGVSAQAGSGYLRLRNQGTAPVYTRVDTSGSFAQGTTEYVSVWVRSTTGAAVNGSLLVGPTGGPAAAQAFTATADWQKVGVNYLLPGQYSTLRTQVRLDASGGDVSLDVDSMTISDQSGPPDGVATPLAHPESGYAYLWDDAFGIRGAHLWDMTAQVQAGASGVGLGIGATVYFDPTKMPDIMTGTAWIKGDMTVNVARYDPCFAVDFDAGNSGSAVSINHGTLTATAFSMYFAPRGCTVGSRVVPVGGSLAFTAAIGEGSVSMSLTVSKDADGNTEMHGSAGIASLVIGGTTFNSLTMTIDKTVTDTTVTLAGDMDLPGGNFTTSLDLSVGANSGLRLQGSAALKDWKLAGGGFDVQSASLSIDMEVPMGTGKCATLDSALNGQMTMAKKTGLNYSGHITVNCGQLQVLHLAYQYYHGGVEADFVLDYSADTGLLSGGAYYSFNRSTSWKFFGYRYRRHPAISIGLTYSMDVNNPSAASEARLAGSVSVSSGSGSLDCSLSSSGDDSCTIDVHISAGGGHDYHDTW